MKICVQNLFFGDCCRGKSPYSSFLDGVGSVATVVLPVPMIPCHKSPVEKLDSRKSTSPVLMELRDLYI